MADEGKKKDHKNVKAECDFKLKGRTVVKGEVVAKDDFPNKQSWQNLLHMPKPRVSETSDPVGKPKKAVAEKMPGA